ncbi:homogentisate 1,2-dioxygenase [Sphingopyxis lindanitolerans]|uniref:Homogentisate 1,2-dioxygenase n=1 Tax=Sphingopyxis lindanitolerans TaxID=2054227 RepID=A0A2S8B0Z7_9SPHN|nr:homogentisate 1,2-dioxygenase [Sphingopyxis lindanitolerans]PQM26030.1 homogentisate 1,2-dioxygenase [Sphingopyxis lindanitolerans]
MAGHGGPGPYLWSRDGFLGANAVALRENYLPDYLSVEGPHAPHRVNLFDLPTADSMDAEALPTPVMTSREGVELAVSRRRAPTPYTVRNAEADELHFIQSGRARIRTDFGDIEAGPLDFVFLPRAVSYRVEPLDSELAVLILSSPLPLYFDVPAPFGMIHFGRSVRRAAITAGLAAEKPHRLWIKSFDGITRFEMAHDPLPAVKQVEGQSPVWALNLKEIHPLAYITGPGGPPGQFLSTADTSVMCYTLSARPGSRPPVHHNADYDELILYCEGPGAWGGVTEPGTLTWVPKAVTHHGPEENVPEGYQAWLLEVRPTMRLTKEALEYAAHIETGFYGLKT